MKTVKLTQEEIDVVLTSLNVRKICESRCYCGYKDNLCNKTKSDGTPVCRLKQTLESIEEKLE